MVEKLGYIIMEEGKKKIRSYRDLDVWKLGMEIVLEVYRLTKKFPKEELYGLVIQMRKAAVSITSNIAEGFNRISNKEYPQFLYISIGSCGELETQTEASYLLEYINQNERNSLIEKLDHESRMLRNLIKKL